LEPIKSKPGFKVFFPQILNLCRYDPDMTKYWGKVFIEFARIETAQIAANSFHRRAFDTREVTVKYFPLSSYQKAFGKGVPPRTHEVGLYKSNRSQTKHTPHWALYTAYEVCRRFLL
jgi:hypothetical protein